MTIYKIHGITDEVTTCDCCGKSKLSRTVGLENESGEVLYFGTTCAARALRQKGKSDVIVQRAMRLQRIRPVADFVSSNMHKGITAAVTAGKEYAATISKDISVSGYDSWGKVNIDGVGARIEVFA